MLKIEQFFGLTFLSFVPPDRPANRIRRYRPDKERKKQRKKAYGGRKLLRKLPAAELKLLAASRHLSNNETGSGGYFALFTFLCLLCFALLTLRTLLCLLCFADFAVLTFLCLLCFAYFALLALLCVLRVVYFALLTLVCFALLTLITLLCLLCSAYFALLTLLCLLCFACFALLTLLCLALLCVLCFAYLALLSFARSHVTGQNWARLPALRSRAPGQN